MTADLLSLTIAMLIAVLSPIIAKIIPGNVVPQTVLLLVAGSILGPHMLGVITLSPAVELLSELGLAFLFLLAGYEINPQQITGHQGRIGLTTWLITLAIAAAAVTFIPFFGANGLGSIATMIALTTTALGTLMPILKERRLEGTPVGNAVIAYGTWGELGPVFAMAILLSSRSGWKTFAILALFAAICILAAALPIKARKAGTAVYRFLTSNANTSSQTLMRLTVFMLIGLITLSKLFDLDVVLGAFAAGFILRFVSPDGVHTLELKLEGVSYGFLIPIFFIVSGADIDISAVAGNPALLIAFIVALLLIRAIPVFLAMTLDCKANPMSAYHRITVAIYCTTALPIIVAVTSVATAAGTMSQATASTLVAAGAVTVFLMPLLGSITYRIAEMHPVEAVREIARAEREIRTMRGWQATGTQTANMQTTDMQTAELIQTATAAQTADTTQPTTMQSASTPTTTVQPVATQLAQATAALSAQTELVKQAEAATTDGAKLDSTETKQAHSPLLAPHLSLDALSAHTPLAPHDWHEVVRAHWAIRQHILHGTPLPTELSDHMTYTQHMLVEAARERRQRLMELGINPDELGAHLPAHYKYPKQ
ncbi:hypothetical protein GCM10007377_11660 [Galliscardovia ingluviei]|uniref:Cation/H+ exchanger transmembrane domain-containing protein n=1 Tax=Galliscardovia ingluviei TaxID=1769422 RepID=A0A8J3AQN3_9BIFI|nr:cation:proton antiporter [Galliscardovia ingluviei]GGI14583.1 hypothetical protein GCM10007377_11660 [Galliscardovia ingluviei]